MPKFTFTIRYGLGDIPLPDPIEATDTDAAIVAARSMARDLFASGLNAGRDRRAWRIDVADESGRVIATVPFDTFGGPRGGGDLGSLMSMR